MKVKITPRTSTGPWIDRIESLFPTDCANMRKTSFLEACQRSGLSKDDRLVGILVSDLRFIRPEDVWLRVLAGERAAARRIAVEPRLDASLAALRVVDAYACRRNASPDYVQKLISVPATVLGRTDESLAEWHEQHRNRMATWMGPDGDATSTRDFARFTPFAVNTALGASEYQTAEQVVRVADEFAALEWLSGQLFSWVRGDGRKVGFATRWLRYPPTVSDVSVVLAEVNGAAARLAGQWVETKEYFDPEWADFLHEQLWASIRFAAIATSLAEKRML